MTEVLKYLPVAVLAIVLLVVRARLRRQGSGGGLAGLLTWLRGRRKPGDSAARGG